MSDTPTPRTDHEIGKCHFYPPEGFIDFARKLERENRELRGAAWQMAEALKHCYDVCEWPADGTGEQAEALAAYRSLSQEKGKQ